MADGRHIEYHFDVTKTTIFANSAWLATDIFPYLSRTLFDFDHIWYAVSMNL